MEEAARARRVFRPGKTVEVEVAVDGECRVREVRVTGDFFVYPEEALERVEEAVRGCRVGDQVCIRERILEASREAEALGFAWEWLAEAIAGVAREACGSLRARG